MNKNWSNTTLVAYSALPKIVKNIDSLVLNRIKSGFCSKHLKKGVTTEQLIGEILNLNDEKRKIINLRLIVVNEIEKISPQDKDILISRIVKKQTMQAISDRLEISLRTVFRRFKNAENNFESALRADGFDEEWFEKQYGNVKVIANIHNRLLNESYFVSKDM